MKGYQFSLRTLLAAIAAIGIGAALWTAKPSWQIGVIEAFLLAWVPASAALLAAHSSGVAKSWWIGIAAGCTFATILLLLADTNWSVMVYSIAPANLAPGRLGQLKVFVETLSLNFQTLLLLWAFAPVVGLLCVLTHWLLIRSADPAEPRD